MFAFGRAGRAQAAGNIFNQPSVRRMICLFVRNCPAGWQVGWAGQVIINISQCGSGAVVFNFRKVKVHQWKIKNVNDDSHSDSCLINAGAYNPIRRLTTLNA